jgi:CHAT domain-containing protein
MNYQAIETEIDKFIAETNVENFSNSSIRKIGRFGDKLYDATIKEIWETLTNDDLQGIVNQIAVEFPEIKEIPLDELFDKKKHFKHNCTYANNALRQVLRQKYTDDEEFAEKASRSSYIMNKIWNANKHLWKPTSQKYKDLERKLEAYCEKLMLDNRVKLIMDSY